MMKSQRSGTKRLPFARLFRWLAIVGFIKLSIFAMILLDFPFPSILDKSTVETETRQAVREYASHDVQGKSTETATTREAEQQKAPQQEAEHNDARRTSLVMPVQQPPLPTTPGPVRASSPEPASDSNVSGVETAPVDEQLFTGPDLPLPPPLPAPIAEPGTVAMENTLPPDTPEHVLPVPTLGNATVAQAAASMPIPQSLAPTQALTPVEQQLPLARDAAMPVPKIPERANQGGPTAPLTPAAPSPILNRTDTNELARQQQDMLVLKKQMDERVKELQDSEAKIKRMLLEARGVEGQKLKTLIQMFGNMKPKTAAKALENMDERTACKILEGLTPKQAGDILSYTNPTITAKLTEVLTHVKIK